MGEHVGPVGINWNDDGPSRIDHYIPIVSPRPHQKLVCVITSNAWVGCYTHFFNNRTHPCRDSMNHCEGCQRRHARRWKAYLCGIMVPGGRHVIIEMTVNALDSCHGLRHDRNQLRGKKITLWRRGDSRNAPVQALLETMKGIDGLPQPFDLQDALCRVWGVRHEEHGNSDSGGLIPA